MLIDASATSETTLFAIGVLDSYTYLLVHDCVLCAVDELKHWRRNRGVFEGLLLPTTIVLTSAFRKHCENASKKPQELH